MDYFAGLDISMDETHVCVVDREGEVVRESKTASMAQAIAEELAKAPSCRRIVFETGRMAPILFHGLSHLGLPVVCIESRQAYQALKSLATHKTDRNDARGLAHLARTGFFKPVHVKSLPAHALRSLIIARKKLVGQRVTLENQIRGLAVVFGIRLPRALTAAFVNQALKASEGVAGLSAAMRGLIAARTAVMTAVAAIDADLRRMARASSTCRRLMTIPGIGQLTALAFVAAIDDPSRIRRSRDNRRLSGPGSKALSVGRGRLRRRHLEMRGPTGADSAVRSRQCHADPLQRPTQAQGLGLRDREAIDDAQGAHRSGASSRDHHARDAAGRNRVRTG
jgi:transposase